MAWLANSRTRVSRSSGGIVTRWFMGRTDSVERVVERKIGP